MAKPILTEKQITDVWDAVQDGTYSSSIFPMDASKTETYPNGNSTTAGDDDFSEKDFFLYTFGWARANYGILSQGSLAIVAKALEIPDSDKFYNMNEHEFTDFFKSRASPDGVNRFWGNLNLNPGNLWHKLDPKEKLFITIDDYVFRTQGTNNPRFFGYLNNEAPVGTLEQYGNIILTDILRPSLQKSSLGGTNVTFDTDWNVGSPTIGKSILVEKVFLEASILEQAIKEIREGGEIGTVDTNSITRLIDKIKNQDPYGYAGLSLYAIDTPDVFTDWVDEEINVPGLTGITDAMAAPLIVFNRSRVVQQGTPTLTAADIEKELMNKDFGYTVNQCILSSGLMELGVWRRNLRTMMYKGVSGSATALGPPYGGRIYCADVGNPNIMMNRLVQPRSLNNLVTKTSYADFANKYGYAFQLFKIEEDDKGSSKKYEYKFETKDGATTLTDIRLKSRAFDSENKDDLSAKVFGLSADRVGAEKIKIENVEISIAGETIATVKSNIDVKIKFKLDSIEAINAVFEADSGYKDNSKKRIKYKFSLLDLLTQQIGREYAGSQASRALKTAYVPTKNRLMLQITPEKYKSGTGADDYFSSGPLMLDLSLLKYSLDKDAVTSKVNITVDFKGYIKSFLNSPMCDVLYGDDIKKELFKKEKETIKDLERNPKYCDIRNLRERLALHFQEMKKIKSSNPQNNFILEPLIKRGMLFKTEVSGLDDALRGNMDPDTRKIILPERLKDTYKIKDIKQVTGTPPSNPMQRASRSSSQNLLFFYFGDLIDVLMDRVYGEAEFNTGATPATVGYYVDDVGNPTVKFTERKRDVLLDSAGDVTPRDSSANVSVIDQKFANFPLKVVMPTIKPLHFNQSTGTYTEHLTEKISIADIPISLSFFSHWFDTEIVKKKIKSYPLGGMINNLLNALVNNVLADSCYRSSSIDRKYFSVATDFGVFDTQIDLNKAAKINNTTRFEVIRKQRKNLYNGMIPIQASDGPVIVKDADVERSDHCNFLIINELINSFATFEGLDLGANKNKILDDNYIVPLKTNRIVKIGKKKFKRSGFVRSINFSKTDLPYGEEIRFSKDGLNELHMLSAVHDASIETLPMFHMYPGQLCWVDAGFLEGTEIYGSIPWVIGMGGFHVVTGVKHSFDVAKGKILKKARTTLETKFISSGATEESTKKFAKSCTDRAGAYSESTP